MPRSPYALRSRARAPPKEIIEIESSDSSKTDEIEQQVVEPEEIKHNTSDTEETEEDQVHEKEPTPHAQEPTPHAQDAPQDDDAFSADIAKAIAQSLESLNAKAIEEQHKSELLAAREIRRQQDLEYEEALAIDRAREAEIKAKESASAQRLLDAQSECAKYVCEEGSFHVRIYDLDGFSHDVRARDGASISTLYAFCLAKLGIDMRERKLSCAWPKEVLHNEPRVLSTFLTQSSVLRIVASL